MDEESIFSQSDEGQTAVYAGPLGATAFESVHWTAPSGNVMSIRVYRVVNAATDPVLAQRLAAGTLNWVRLEEDDQLYPVRVPVLYHDPVRRLFALVLPEDFRCRELEERASLLQRLAEDKAHALPRYVVHFDVLYGHESLRALLDGRMSGRVVETTPVKAVSREHLRQSASSDSVTQPSSSSPSKAGLSAAPDTRQDYEITGRVLEVTEADLLAVEELASGKEKVGLRNISEPLDGARAVLQAEAEAVLEEMEEIDGWPSSVQGRGTGRDLLDEKAGPSSQPSSDADVTRVSRLDKDASEGRSKEEGEPGDRAGAAVVDQNPQDTRAAASEPGPPQSVLSRSDVGSERLHSGEESALVPESDAEDESESHLPGALADWPDSGDDARLYVETGDQPVVVLAAKGSTETIMGFLGSDAEVLIQLHEMPTYPLVVLAALPRNQSNLARFWLLDVLDDSHLDVLDRLTEDFRVQVDIYDESFRRRVSVRAHYPLEENTKLIRKTAMEHLTAMGDEEPDFEAARAQWSGEDFPRLGDREHAFTVRSFEKIDTASQVVNALGIVEWWADAQHEPYLLLVKSFPAVWWRKIKNRVVKAALEYGLWPPQALVSFALAEGLATSKKDLVRHCLDRFCHTCEDPRRNDLDVGQEYENWVTLLAEADAAGIVPSEEVEVLVDRARSRRDSVVGSTALGDEQGDGDDALPLDDADIVEEQDDVVEADPVQSADASAAEMQDSVSGLTDGQPMKEPLGGEDLFAPGSGGDDASSGPETGASPSSWKEDVQVRSMQEFSREQLVDLLDDKETRLPAALILSERRDSSALSPLFDAVAKMTRSEVLEVLPGLVAFGAAAEGHFIELLSSNKSFLRQGAALALGILRSGPAVEALVDCLLAEPTGIWREVARVVGEMGKAPVMILASRLKSASGEGRERIAWALAHMAATTQDMSLLEDLARSADSVMEAVAKRAADLVGEAREAARIYDQDPSDDETVVVSFTRAFMHVLTSDLGEIQDDDILEDEDLSEE